MFKSESVLINTDNLMEKDLENIFTSGLTDHCKHIVVEGCDLTGKTSVINYLTDLYKDTFTVVKGTYKNINDYYSWATLYLSKSPLLFDRSHVSTLIYEPIKNDKSLLTDVETMALEYQTFAVGMLNVYLICSLDKLIERYEQRGDDYLTRIELLDVYEQYLDYYKLIQLINIEEHKEKVDEINLYRKNKGLPSKLAKLRELDEQQYQEDVKELSEKNKALYEKQLKGLN